MRARTAAAWPVDYFVLCALTYSARWRSEAKMRSLSSLSARSCTPYCLETTRAISRISIESRPSPSPYRGWSGPISAAETSRFSAATISPASSRVRAVMPADPAGCLSDDTLSDIADLGRENSGWHYTREAPWATTGRNRSRRTPASAPHNRSACDAAPDQQRQTHQEREEEPCIHPGEEHIVAPVIEVRHAAFRRSEVTAGCGKISHRYAAPRQAHDRLGVEIEAPHPAGPLHHLKERFDRIHAEPEQGIGDPCPERLELGPPVGDAPPPQADARCARVEDRRAEDHGLGRRARCAHESPDALRRMLAVGVHGEHVRVAGARRRGEPIEDRRALAAVTRPDQHPQSRVVPPQPGKQSRRAVGAAVDDHP